jgi:hypothetical protein
LTSPSVATLTRPLLRPAATIMKLGADFRADHEP